MTRERWLAVPGYEGCYEVSDQGQVRSLDRRSTRGAHSVLARGRVLTPKFTPYPTVSLWLDGRQYTRRVHTLVAEAFIGPRPPGMYVCHGNGDETDNRLENLRYDTPSANELDTVRHGRHSEARKTHCKNGHEFTPENTYTGSGQRRCNECHRLRSIEYRRQRAAS